MRTRQYGVARPSCWHRGTLRWVPSRPAPPTAFWPHTSAPPWLQLCVRRRQTPAARYPLRLHLSRPHRSAGTRPGGSGEGKAHCTRSSSTDKDTNTPTHPVAHRTLTCTHLNLRSGQSPFLLSSCRSINAVQLHLVQARKPLQESGGGAGAMERAVHSNPSRDWRLPPMNGCVWQQDTSRSWLRF